MNMDKVEKLLQRIASVSVHICASITVVWVFVFTAYIISRYFNLGWVFVEEFTGYWLVLIAYIPLAYAFMTGAHIRIGILTNRLPQKIRMIFQLCTDWLALLFVLYLMGRSIEWLIHGIQYHSRSSAALNITLWPIYLIIPLGLALFSAMLMVKTTKGTLDVLKERGLIQK